MPTEWSLIKEFEHQQAFFNFLATIRYLSVENVSLLNQFKDLVPGGRTEEYRLQILEQENMQLRNDIGQLQNALRQVAERMNAAGNCLSFGF
jgi:hypothetical protein